MPKKSSKPIRQGAIHSGRDVVFGNQYNIEFRAREAANPDSVDNYRLRVLVVQSVPFWHAAPASLEIDLEDVWSYLEQSIMASSTPIDVVRLQPPTVDTLRHALSKQPGTSEFAPNLLLYVGRTSGGHVVLQDDRVTVDSVSISDLVTIVQKSSVQLVIALSVVDDSLELGTVAKEIVGGSVKAAVEEQLSSKIKPQLQWLVKLLTNLANGETFASSILVQGPTLTDRPRVIAGDLQFSIPKEDGLRPLASRPRIKSGFPKNNIPRGGMFWGRGEEAKTLIGYLADASSKCVIVTGIAGIGKSKLTQEIARRLAWRFPGGIAWISARESDKFAFAQATSDMLYLLDSALLPGQSAHLALISYIRTHPTLLVFDNAEVVSGQEFQRMAGFVEAMDAGWSSRVVICMRQPVSTFQDIIGCHYLAIHRGLDDNSGMQYLRAILNAPGLAAIHDFDLQALRVVSVVDGHPKILEIFAGIVKNRGWSYASSLLSRLPHSLADTLDYFYAQAIRDLGPHGKRVLQYLPMFQSGSFSMPMLRVVAGEGEGIWRDAAHVLSGVSIYRRIVYWLRRQQSRREEQGWIDHGIDELLASGLVGYNLSVRRYSIHKTVADFISQHNKQDRDDRAGAVFLFAGYCLLYVKSNSANTGAIDVEWENIRGILNWLWDELQVQTVEGPSLFLWNYMLHIRDFLIESQRWREAELWIGRTIKACKILGYHSDEAQFSFMFGILRQRAGDIEHARELYSTSIATAENLLINLVSSDDKEKARVFVTEVRSALDDLPAPSKAPITVDDWLANGVWAERIPLLAMVGETARARESVKTLQGLTINSQDRFGYAMTLGMLAWLAEVDGKQRDADRLYAECMDILEAYGGDHAQFMARLMGRPQRT